MKFNSRSHYSKTRAGGLHVSIGKRLTTGPLLTVSGHGPITDALSDLPTLSKYAEIEIAGLGNSPSIFITSASLVSNPQILLGYQNTGLPILLGVKNATGGHVSIIGPTPSGKFLTIADTAYYICRVRDSTFVIGLKELDEILRAEGKGSLEEKQLSVETEIAAVEEPPDILPS